MFLSELEISNWLIIREAHLLFAPSNPVVGLVGRYDDEDERGRSNRAGKTSLVLAQLYLLFGKSKTRNHVKLINRTARANGEGMRLRGVFNLDDGSTLEIIRERDKSGAPSVTIAGAEGLGWEQANELIAERIGFTYDEYMNTCFFGQGQIHQFMNAQPREKRELLLSWLNQYRWELRREYAKREAGEAEQDVNRFEAMLTALPAPELTVDELEGELADLLDAISTSETALENARAELVHWKQRRERVLKYRQLENKKGDLVDAIEDTEQRLELAESKANRKDELEEQIEAIETQLDMVRESFSAQLKEANEKVGAAQAEKRTTKAALSRLESVGGVCPVLSEPCDRVGEEATAPLETQARGATEALQMEIAERDALQNERGARVGEFTSQIEERRAQVRALGDCNVERWERELDRLEGELDATQKELKGLTNLPLDVDVSKMIEEAEQDISGLTEKLGGMNADKRNLTYTIEQAEKYEERKQGLETKLEQAKVNQSSWAYCQFMFSSRGIPGEYIKGAFDTLEEDINYILGRMNSGLSVEFKPYRETGKYEKHCLACGNEHKPRKRKCERCGEPRAHKLVEQLVLNIHDAREGITSEFDLDSGGGQVLISFAVRLALLFLKAREGGGSVPPIVLDEIAGFLDPVNRGAVINVILNILTNEYGVQQVFWISHNEEILDMLEDALAVTRCGNHSVVDWI